MEKRWCSACGDTFEPRTQAPRQSYCSKAACQRTRKRLWQRTKRQTDDDYRENQALAQEGWRRAHPDYWRQYRQAHPDYTEANRRQQKDRNARRNDRETTIANVDATPLGSLVTGIYRLTLLAPDPIGPRREWTVRLEWIRPA